MSCCENALIWIKTVSEKNYENFDYNKTKQRYEVKINFSITLFR